MIEYVEFFHISHPDEMQVAQGIDHLERIIAAIARDAFDHSAALHRDRNAFFAQQCIVSGRIVLWRDQRFANETDWSAAADITEIGAHLTAAAENGMAL